MAHKTRWLISQVISNEGSENLSEFSLIMRQLLFNRGYETAEEARAFLNGAVLFDSSPFNLKGMDFAINRINAAISNGEEIAVYGDYDVDGVTATVLLVSTIQFLGGKARPYIPHRFDEGYGINNDALDKLAKEGVTLVISVDCGIRSPNEARYSESIGINLIITDHHEPAGEFPKASCVINPKQEGDTYPEKYLAGVGVAYKIAQALVIGKKSGGGTGEWSARERDAKEFLDSLLDLVALGTIADLAPLVGENRKLVLSGLAQIKTVRRQGLFALANVAGITLTSITSANIGYILGPRLNAAGRLESAMAAYKLLSEKDVKVAAPVALILDQQNRDRQEITRQIQILAEQQVFLDDSNPLVLFAISPDYNSGVVGLTAARLVEKYYRPAIVGQQSAETIRCSCRSIPDFNITLALDQCADLLVRHGGHAAAAGFTVRVENWEPLKKRLKELAAASLRGVDLRSVLTADMVLPLVDLRPSLIPDLAKLQPTGYGNPDATFVSRNVLVTRSRTVGADNQHLKLTISDGRLSFDAIGFRMGDRLADLPSRIDVFYSFETNTYNGKTTFQLNLKDLKPAGLPD